MQLFQSNALPGGRVRHRYPVYFCRHGQTDWNAARRFQGHADIPLNDVGRAQAGRNGLALKNNLEADAASLRCFVSPLSRARETLEIIRAALKMPPRRYTVDDRLIEIDLGDWNGKTPEEIEQDTPGAFEEREKDKWAYRVPGGESYEAAAARTREFLIEQVLNAKGPTLIVGHGASGRLLRGYLTGRSKHDIPHMEARQDVILRLHRGSETAL